MVPLVIHARTRGIPNSLSEGESIPTREISWTCHPARERPVAAVLVALLIVFLGVAAQHSWGVWYITVIVVAVLWLSVAPFYLPVKFVSDEENVTVKTLTTSKVKPWSRFRRAAADHRGAILSPFEHRSRLDRFHGLNLRYDMKDRDRVIEYLKSRLPVDIANGN